MHEKMNLLKIDSEHSKDLTNSLTVLLHPPALQAQLLEILVRRFHELFGRKFP